LSRNATKTASATEIRIFCAQYSAAVTATATVTPDRMTRARCQVDDRDRVGTAAVSTGEVVSDRYTVQLACPRRGVSLRTPRVLQPAPTSSMARSLHFFRSSLPLPRMGRSGT